MATETTSMFASLNVGLQKQEACGTHATARFKAIACGVADVFRKSGAQAVGLVEVGDPEDGLPQQQSNLLKQHIRDALSPDISLQFHSDGVGSPYMLMSRQAVLGACRTDFTNVRVETGFLSQKWRKALCATFTGPGGEVQLWLVHLASSKNHKLSTAMRKEMLNKLQTATPTIIAGDLNTGESLLKDWMQQEGANFNPMLANSGAPDPRHGDHTIAVNAEMWQVTHNVGRSFESANEPHVSDNHDVVLIALKTRRPDLDELRSHLKEEKTPSEGGTTNFVACPKEEWPTTADADELGGAADHARPSVASR